MEDKKQEVKERMKPAVLPGCKNCNKICQWNDAITTKGAIADGYHRMTGNRARYACHSSF